MQESTCRYGCIHMSEVTKRLLDSAGEGGQLQHLGKVEVKGKVGTHSRDVLHVHAVVHA
jgi:hypothetical protein